MKNSSLDARNLVFFFFFLIINACHTLAGVLFAIWIANCFICFMHRHLFHSKNICPSPTPHFASIFFAHLWSFRWPNYIVTRPRYFSFRLPHLNIPTGIPSDELDKTIQRKWLGENLSHWNGYNHFRFALDFSYAFGIL